MAKRFLYWTVRLRSRKSFRSVARRVADPQASSWRSASQSRPVAEASEAERGHRRSAARRTPRPSVTAYVDASVVLRLALGQANALVEWSKIRRGVSSALVIPESLRTLDRLRLRAKLSDAEVATRRAAVLSLI